MINMYSIYDKVERKFSFPFTSNTDEGAVRRMKSADIFKNVSQNDFELFYIGRFDEDGNASKAFESSSSSVIWAGICRKVDWNLDVKEGSNE